MNFIYRLKLIDRLIPEENWTKADESIVSDHFSKLLELKKDNLLLLAGKTEGQDKDTFGIVIFKANSYDEALKIMNNDPAISNGIMNGHLQEFNIAILNKEYKKD